MSRSIQNCQTYCLFTMQILICRLRLPLSSARGHFHTNRRFTAQPKPRLLGKNRNSTRPLLRIRIQKCILMIHTPQRADLPGGI